MGTINYGTSNYITMGVQPEYPWEYNENSAIMDEMRELAEEWGCSVDEAISQNIQHNLEADIMDTTMDSTSISKIIMA